jgi:hypothetical protein
MEHDQARSTNVVIQKGSMIAATFIVASCLVAVVVIQLVRAGSFDLGGSCDTAELISLIEAANATPEADTINLFGHCTYTLTTPHNIDGSIANGFPVITSSITINGHGATIVRSDQAGTPSVLWPCLWPSHLSSIAALLLSPTHQPETVWL